MLTIWALVQALSSITGQPDFEPTNITAITGVKLKLIKENEYTLFYESEHPLSLEHGVVVGTLELRQAKQHSRPPFVVLQDLRGACITLDDLRNHVSDLSPPIPPSNPVPNASIMREAKMADQRLALGFKWSVPDCLASIALHNN